MLNEYAVTSGCLPPPSSSASSRASRTGAPGSCSRRRQRAPDCRQGPAHFQTPSRPGARLQCLVAAPLPRPHAPRRTPARRSRQQHGLWPTRRRSSPHGAGHTPCCPRAEAPRVPVPGAQMKRARFYQDPDAPGAFAGGGSVPNRRRDDGGGEGRQQRARAHDPADCSPTARWPQPPPPAARRRPAGGLPLAGETTGQPQRSAAPTAPTTLHRPCCPRSD